MQINRDIQFNKSDFKYIDAHTHFFPEKLFKAIWSYWDRIYVPFFPAWKNIYNWSIDELTSFINREGIEFYTTLNYAHKPGMAETLNQWTHTFCSQNNKAIPLGTAHPDDDNFIGYVKKALTDFKFKGLKLHLSITDFYIHDNRLDPLHKILMEHDKVLVVHAGTAPGIDRKTFPGAKVGAYHFQKYLEKFPDNKVIVAHMGGYDYESFFKIAEQNPNVYLDTAMVWVPLSANLFPEKDRPENIESSSRVYSFMESCSSQILFGSDYPFIPYDYEQSINELLKLPLTKSAFKNIFYNNAKRIFKL